MQLPQFLVAIPRNPVIAIGLPLAFGIGSGLVTRSSVNTWYQTQKKPPGEPPRALFPIAWTTLYAGMGYASHLLVKALDQSPSIAVRHHAHTALSLHWAQLALNLAWTPLFFGAHKPRLALVDIVLLTGTVYKLTIDAFKVNRIAGWIYLLYSGWLSYATYLNSGVVLLNDPKAKQLR